MSYFFSYQESPSLLSIEACTLSFVLQIHSPLEKVFHLIPENAIMSGDDFVPGILEPQPDGNFLLFYLHSMLYQKIIEKLQLKFYSKVQF